MYTVTQSTIGKAIRSCLKFSTVSEREGLELLARLILSFVLEKYGTKNSRRPVGSMLRAQVSEETLNNFFNIGHKIRRIHLLFLSYVAIVCRLTIIIGIKAIKSTIYEPCFASRQNKAHALKKGNLKMFFRNALIFNPFLGAYVLAFFYTQDVDACWEMCNF